MNSLLNDERDEDVEDSRSRYGKDREITLGTTVVLGIFFALAVFGAVMFGFGYSVGVKHMTETTTAQVGSGSSSNFGSFKPAPGSPLCGPPAGPANGKAGASVAVPYDASQTAPPTPLPRPAPVSKASTDDFDAIPSAEPAPARAPVTSLAAARAIPAPATPIAPTPVTPSTVATGQFMVQVAAVSHQEDADLLVSTLKRRSYAVAVHHEPQDSLLHVQIGPFATKKDADAMRQRLLADGYNAITK